MTLVDELSPSGQPLASPTPLALELPPLATGLVIGVGGSGIQTISRVRRAVAGARPDQSAVASLVFLGIDAVDLSGQHPRLPPSTGLVAEEFLNITDPPFDASDYVRHRLPVEARMQEWWDSRYQPPVGPITEGLRRSRMLGRLAFHRAAPVLESRLVERMRTAVEIRPEHVAGGHVGGRQGTDLDVSIVASSCGGTGSSGLLEVLYRVWVAARSLDVHPDVRLFVYLPGVFATEVERAPGGEVISPAHKANAYAFFRELDHFLTHAEDLSRYLGTGREAADIDGMQLAKQVYVIDNTVGAAGMLRRATDLFDIVAEAMYQLALTEMGRPLQTTMGVNLEEVLSRRDDARKRRAYCSLGVARIVFPGTTLERHLRFRFAHEFVMKGLLCSPDDLRTQVTNDPSVREWSLGLPATIQRARRQRASRVSELADLATTVVTDIEAEPSSITVARMEQRIEDARTAAAADLRDAAVVVENTLLPQLEQDLADALLGTGRGLRFATLALGVLDERLAEARQAAANTRERAVQELETVDAEMAEKRDVLTRVEGSFFLSHMPGRLARAARQVGDLLGARALAAQTSLENDEQVRLLDDLRARLRGLRDRLQRADDRLSALARTLDAGWREDVLIGKDAGPRDTTTLLPTDILPEVEDSRLAVSLFQQVLADLAEEAKQATSIGEGVPVFAPRLVAEALRSWHVESGGFGVLALGSTEDIDATRSHRGLLQMLDNLAVRHVLHDRDSEPRLPRDLRQSAMATTDGEERLQTAAQGLATLASNVCWRIDDSRLRLPEGEALPGVSTLISRPRAVSYLDPYLGGASQVDETDPDPQRIVALSISWGYPAYALAPLDTWRFHYDRVLDALESGRQIDPPHVDRRFVDELEPLEPLAYQRGDALLAVGKALVISKVLVAADASGDERILRRFDRQRGKPAAAGGPLWSEVRGAELTWVGSELARRDGAWKVERSLDLGPDLVTAVARAGSAFGWMRGVDAVVDDLARPDRLGRAGLAEAVSMWLDDELEEMLRDLEPDAPLAVTLADMGEELTAWLRRVKSPA